MKKGKEKKHFIEQPYYKGGDKALTNFIYKNLRFPKEADVAGVEGTVFLEYDIDYQGNVTDARIIQSIGYGCDEEAIRVIRLLKFEVGKYRGVRVVFHKKAKIQFKRLKIEAQTPPATLPFEVQYHVLPKATSTPEITEKTQETYHYQINF